MKIKKFQEGGVAPEAGTPPAGAPPAGGGPEEQIMQMAQQVISSLGPEGAAMLAQTIMQVLQSAPAEAAPQGQPVYARKGGKLVVVNRK